MTVWLSCKNRLVDSRKHGAGDVGAGWSRAIALFKVGWVESLRPTNVAH